MECADPNKVPESQAFLLGHVGALWVQFLLNFHPCELHKKQLQCSAPSCGFHFLPQIAHWVCPTHFQDSEWRVQWWSNNTPVPECFSANERAYQPTTVDLQRGLTTVQATWWPLGVWRNNPQLEGFVKFSGVSFWVGLLVVYSKTQSFKLFGWFWVIKHLGFWTFKSAAKQWSSNRLPIAFFSLVLNLFWDD